MKNFHELDFDSIKENFKEFLESKTEFTDYNFEGSALNSLLDVFAYAIHYQTFYLNMSLSEMFLETAELDNSVHQISNMLNYTPKRKSSPKISITLNKGANPTVTIPKHTKWLLDDDISLVNMEDVVMNTANDYTIDLYQGDIITENFTSSHVDGSSDYEVITLTYKENVDNDFFYLYVDRWDEDSEVFVVDGISWEGVRNHPGLGDKKFYLEYMDEFKIKFDNGSLYSYPIEDDQIRVVYLRTDGAKYNGSTGDLVVDSDANSSLAATITSDVTITLNTTLKDGTSEDTIENIKNFAPQFYTTQNRAVTENDYKTLIRYWSYYESLFCASLWGGEKEALNASNKMIEYLPDTEQDLDLGHVYVTAINSDFTHLDESKIEGIKTFFDDYRIISIFMQWIYPNIVTINPDLKIHKKDIFGVSESDIRQDVVTYLEGFKGADQRFNKSNFLRAVDGITGVDYSDVNFTLSCEVYHEDYKIIRLNNAVTTGSISGTVNGYTLDDDGLGNIRFNGGNVGTINYDTGFITIDLVTNPNALFIPDADNLYSFSFEYQNQYTFNFERETLLNYDNSFAIDFDSI